MKRRGGNYEQPNPRESEGFDRDGFGPGNQAAINALRTASNGLREDGRTVEASQLERAAESLTANPLRNAERFRIWRLCQCTACGGSGKEPAPMVRGSGNTTAVPLARCAECRGEGKVRQEIATCATPEAVGVAIVTLAREGEFEECPIGILDSEGEVGQKWLIRPWLPSARNVSDAGRMLRASQRGEK